MLLTNANEHFWNPFQDPDFISIYHVDVESDVKALVRRAFRYVLELDFTFDGLH